MPSLLKEEIGYNWNEIFMGVMPFLSPNNSVKLLNETDSLVSTGKKPHPLSDTGLIRSFDDFGTISIVCWLT